DGIVVESSGESHQEHEQSSALAPTTRSSRNEFVDPLGEKTFPVALEGLEMTSPPSYTATTRRAGRTPYRPFLSEPPDPLTLRAVKPKPGPGACALHCSMM
ncbi:hypothetical protein CABS01_12475, partial [Colletotrichum abscissum]